MQWLKLQQKKRGGWFPLSWYSPVVQNVQNRNSSQVGEAPIAPYLQKLLYLYQAGRGFSEMHPENSSCLAHTVWLISPRSPSASQIALPEKLSDPGLDAHSRWILISVEYLALQYTLSFNSASTAIDWKFCLQSSITFAASVTRAVRIFIVSSHVMLLFPSDREQCVSRLLDLKSIKSKGPSPRGFDLPAKENWRGCVHRLGVFRGRVIGGQPGATPKSEPVDTASIGRESHIHAILFSHVISGI
jgi:hypothetical protein